MQQIPRHRIEFHPEKRTSSIITFGGMPRWHASPQWPINSLDHPLVYLGQISLSKDLIPSLPSDRIAYIFFDRESFLTTDSPRSPDGTLLLQPGSPNMQTAHLDNGPGVRSYHSGHRFVEKQSFGSIVPEHDPTALSDDDALEECWIGGDPIFWNEEDSPIVDRNDYVFLFQLSGETLPFLSPFEGILYGFVSNTWESGVVFSRTNY